MTHLMAHCAHMLRSVPERLTDLFILLFNKSLKVERLTTTHFSLDTLRTSDWPLLLASTPERFPNQNSNP